MACSTSASEDVTVDSMDDMERVVDDCRWDMPRSAIVRPPAKPLSSMSMKPTSSPMVSDTGATSRPVHRVLRNDWAASPVSSTGSLETMRA